MTPPQAYFNKSVRVTTSEHEEILSAMNYLGIERFSDFVRMALKEQCRTVRRRQAIDTGDRDEIDVMIEEKLREREARAAGYGRGHTQVPFVAQRSTKSPDK